MQASVQNMIDSTDRHSADPAKFQAAGKSLFSVSKAGRFASAGLAIAFILSSPVVGAAGAQAPSPQAAAVPAIGDSLRPSLDRVGSALNQVQIDRWKLSRELKNQFRGDANSIEQDLSSQLPGLFQAAQQAPAQLGPQLSVLHNVDALYDVLVRIATAAGIAGGKNDAAILDSAVQQLESARKNVSIQLLQVASGRDLQLAHFQAAATQAAMSENAHPKTIVVDNRVGPRSRHHKAALHRKPPGNGTSAKPAAGAATVNPNSPK